MDKEGSHKKIIMAIRISMIISIPAAVGMGVLADQVTRFIVSGARYKKGKWVKKTHQF